MIIRMLETARGSNNGVIIKRYEEGGVYEVNDDLGRVFIEDMGVAEDASGATEAGDGEVVEGSHQKSRTRETPPRETTTDTPKEKPDGGPGENTADGPGEAPEGGPEETGEGKKEPEPVEIILSKGGQPYKKEKVAKSALKSRKLADTHEVVAVEGGFGLRPKTDKPAARTRG